MSNLCIISTYTVINNNNIIINIEAVSASSVPYGKQGNDSVQH